MRSRLTSLGAARTGGARRDAEKPSAEKPSAEKPSAEKPSAEKPSAEKPSAARPGAGAVAVAAAVLALAGCTNKPADAAESMPPVTIVEQPAASAGGACILWDYAFIQQQIGVKFTVAAADQVEDTSTCVVQTDTGEYPDLTLAVVESTTADGSLFIDNLMPKKATKLKGLGKAGYRLVSPAGAGHGPTVEIGWLSEAEQLQTLKFTFGKGARPSAVSEMSTRLLSLAKAMDTTA